MSRFRLALLASITIFLSAYLNFTANVERPPYSLQKLAIEMLGELHVIQSKPLLNKIAEKSGDDNLRVLR